MHERCHAAHVDDRRVLLVEASHDKDLSRYDALIIDEAHERTLNIDLLLGLVRNLLQRRAELRVIVTSATLDVERIGRYYSAPVIRVSGDTHPVEIRYRAPPSGGDEEIDALEALRLACREYQQSPGEARGGSILAFLPGERQISEARDALAQEFSPHFEICALHSQMPWEAQRNLLDPGARPRLVLATNLAETSLSIPGVRCVIDSGLARISRFSPRERMQQLQIERISQASATQRLGRCNRFAPGLCIRLYREEDLFARPRFTDPEVLRTHLAGLILRLLVDGLGRPENFPFLDSPSKRAWTSGYRTLNDLQALDAAGEITAVGREMARLPLDPHIARALVASRTLQSLREVSILAAALSVPEMQVPRRTSAGREHSRGSRDSDLMRILERWRAFEAIRKRAPRLHAWCRQQGLSLARLREWQNVHDQLRALTQHWEQPKTGAQAGYAAIHRAMLAGFFGSVGLRQERQIYAGLHGTRFSIHPESVLAQSPPEWILACKITRTTRALARCAARVRPGWIADAASHLITRDYYGADWDERAADVTAHERVALSGLTLSAGRKVRLARFLPAEARRIFIREGLVQRRLLERPAWLAADDALLDAASRIEERVRMRGLRLSEQALIDHYEEILPEQASSGEALAAWTCSRALSFTSLGTAFAQPPLPEKLEQLPEHVPLHGTRVRVEYRFDPGAEDDGASLRIPPLLLPILTRSEIGAAIPAFESPRALHALRTLPKPMRISLQPLARTAAAYVQWNRARHGAVELSEWLRSEHGIDAGAALASSSAPSDFTHPRMLVVQDGRLLGHGRDVGSLRRAHAAVSRSAADAAALASFPDSWREFAVDVLPEHMSAAVEDGAVRMFPALSAREALPRVQLFWSREEAEEEHRLGVAALLRFAARTEIGRWRRRVESDGRLALIASPFTRGEDWADAALQRGLHDFIDPVASSIRSRNEFTRLVERFKHDSTEIIEATCHWLSRVFGAAHAARQGTDAADLPELRALLLPSRWRDAHADFARHFFRYVQSAARGAQRSGSRSAARLEQVGPWELELERLRRGFAAELRWHPDLARLEWMVEEYRASLKSQELKTAIPVSPERLRRVCEELDAWLAR